MSGPLFPCDWGRNFQIGDPDCQSEGVRSVRITDGTVHFDHKFCRPHVERAKALVESGEFAR